MPDEDFTAMTDAELHTYIADKSDCDPAYAAMTDAELNADFQARCDCDPMFAAMTDEEAKQWVKDNCGCDSPVCITCGPCDFPSEMQYVVSDRPALPAGTGWRTFEATFSDGIGTTAQYRVLGGNMNGSRTITHDGTSWKYEEDISDWFEHLPDAGPFPPPDPWPVKTLHLEQICDNDITGFRQLWKFSNGGPEVGITGVTPVLENCRVTDFSHIQIFINELLFPLGTTTVQSHINIGVGELC